MTHQTTSRRRFLICAIATSAALTTGFDVAVLRAGTARAQAPAAVPPEARQTLLRMVRGLFPHDSLADDVYAEIVDALLAASDSDVQLDSALDQAVEALNAASDRDFFELTQASQLAVMQSVADSEFFTAITGHVRFRLYTHPALWETIDYPGSSVEYGGYLERGFNDIDWLPEEG